jgi:hypothetical protein
MRVSACINLVFCLLAALGPASARADEDDLVLRIESMRAAAEKARVEAARAVQADADRRAKELEERLAEVKKWTTAQFELGERGVINKPKVMSDLLARWQKANEQEIYRLLQFPEKSKGAIESGRALNSLLDRVGPAADQNRRTRQISPESALPLHAASEYDQVTEDTFDRLTIQDRLLGARDSRRGNGEPLDVDWPAILREPRWVPYCAAVEKARREALNEMATAQGLSPETDRRLRDAVAALNSAFAAYRKEWREKYRRPETAATEIRRIWAGAQHIQHLIAATYYLIEAKTMYELPQRQEFHGGNIEFFRTWCATICNLASRPRTSTAPRITRSSIKWCAITSIRAP